ncbi:MAG: hypothetical protein AAF829_07720 [Pseudomonadota bacterium]
MVLRLIFMAAWLAFVAACSEQIGSDTQADTGRAGQAPGEEPAPFEPPARPIAVASQSRIDWQAARTDLASTPSTATPEAFQIQSGDLAPPVPVLLPTGIVTTASATDGPRFIQLPDGYLASYPGADYDITVSGTNEVFDVAPGLGDGVADLTYAGTVDGAMVSFSRYGAGYMVEFVCKGLEGESGSGCIAEDEALDVAQDLVIAGSR